MARFFGHACTVNLLIFSSILKVYFTPAEAMWSAWTNVCPIRTMMPCITLSAFPTGGATPIGRDEKGPLRREAVLLSVWRWEPSRQRAQALQLLIFRELDGSQVKYSLCYIPPAGPELAVAQALYRQMQRCWIERVFQEAKQPLGLHQNQTRHWPAWQYHVALTMMAWHFRLEAQLERHETIPYLPFASRKLPLAQKL